MTVPCDTAGVTRVSRGSALAAAAWLAAGACTAVPTQTAGPSGSSFTPATPEPSATETNPPRAVTVEWRPVELPMALGPDDPISGPVAGESGAIALVSREGQGRPTLLSSPDGTRWRISPIEAGGFAGQAVALFAVPGGYVAIVREGSPGEPPEQLRAWLSRDGRSWTRGGVLPLLNDVDLQAAEGGAIVVCSYGEEEAEGTICLRSIDGAASWSLVTDPTGDLARAEALDRIVAAPPGFLAAGSLDGQVRLWRSGDGDRWTLLPADERLSEVSWTAGLVRGRTGFVLAAGVRERDRRHGDRTVGTLWYSPDGLAWAQLPLPDIDASGGFDLVALGDAYAAVAIHAFFNDVRASAVLTSADGRHWRADPLPDLLAGWPPRLVALRDHLLALQPTDDGGQRLALGLLAPVADPGPFPTPTPTPTAPPPVPSEEPVPGIVWRRLPHLGPGEIRDVAAGGPGFVAVGRDDSGEGGAAAWTSTDGETWTRAPDSPAFRLGAMETVSRGGPGLVAAGWIYRPEAPPDRAKIAAFWTSRDGVTWERAPHNADLEIGGDVIDGWNNGVRTIVAGGPGLIAVGATDRGGAVWTSTDGVDWRLAARLDDGVPADVVAGGPGFVAVGSTGEEGWQPQARAWASQDGLAWERVQPDLDGPALTAVTARADGGLVAVGAGPGMWTSADGIKWAWAPDQPALDEGSASDVAASAAGIVAVGSRPCPDGQRICPTAWLSSGGLAWIQAPATPNPAEGSMNGVVARERVFIALGWTGPQDEPAASVWLGLPGT